MAGADEPAAPPQATEPLRAEFVPARVSGYAMPFDGEAGVYLDVGKEGEFLAFRIPVDDLAWLARAVSERILPARGASRRAASEGAPAEAPSPARRSAQFVQP